MSFYIVLVFFVEMKSKPNLMNSKVLNANLRARQKDANFEVNKISLNCINLIEIS